MGFKLLVILARQGNNTEVLTNIVDTFDYIVMVDQVIQEKGEVITIYAGSTDYRTFFLQGGQF